MASDSGGGGPAAAKYQNQVNNLEATLAEIELRKKEIEGNIKMFSKSLEQNREQILALQSVPFAARKKIVPVIEKLDDALEAGDFALVRKLLKTDGILHFQFAESVMEQSGTHDKFLQEVEKALEDRKFDLAIDKAQTALRHILKSRELQKLLETAKADKEAEEKDRKATEKRRTVPMNAKGKNRSRPKARKPAKKKA